jgi:arsenical pump membrane protein
VHRGVRIGAVVALVGGTASVLAAILDSSGADSAAHQDWSPFVLVAGLILAGFAAERDGVFEFIGRTLAGAIRSELGFYLAAVMLTVAVTAPLNLDTTVAFLTPVFVHAARHRDSDDGPTMYGCLYLANAGSLLLPGSNLTNLIVLGRLHLQGTTFLAKTWPAWAASVAVTAIVVGLAHRRSLTGQRRRESEAVRVEIGVGAIAIVAVTVIVLIVRDPAVPVFCVGALAALASALRHHDRLARVIDVLGPGILVGLYGIAVALGTAGRAWDGPAIALAHLDRWATAAFATAASVVVNNLPAASLLSARVPPHPYSLLIGLDDGPNLAVTGSLAWLLWLRAARQSGGRPSLRRASALGAVVAVLSIVAAVGAVTLAGLG